MIASTNQFFECNEILLTSRVLLSFSQTLTQIKTGEIMEYLEALPIPPTSSFPY